ncbi:MAG TPA: hypothetical protein PLJ87_05855, partial [Anaerolineaceae bacterium]|nr:hypothetical protein [Anaerolineaceae bacterium]
MGEASREIVQQKPCTQSGCFSPTLNISSRRHEKRKLAYYFAANWMGEASSLMVLEGKCILF